MTYIYGLFCPIAQTIRYVGKSDDPDRRLREHVESCCRNSHHTARWIAALKRKGLQPSVIVLAEVSDEEWQQEERRFIASAESFRWKLTNSTPGGEGCVYLRPQDKEAWRKKVKAGVSNPEVRAKISIGVRKSYESPLVRANAGVRSARNWMNPEYRLRVSSGISASMSTPENKKKTADRGKALMALPGAREAVSARLKAYCATSDGKENRKRIANDPVKKEKSRNGQLKNWADPEYRKKHLAEKRSPESVSLAKEKARQQWANPDVRERMLAAMKASRDKQKAAKA